MTSDYTRMLVPLIEEERTALIINAINDMSTQDFSKYKAYSDLMELSSNTIIEAIDVNPEGIFISETDSDHFEVSAKIYAKLEYGQNRDFISSSESYPAIVTGHFQKSIVKIDNIEVDTSSF